MSYFGENEKRKTEADYEELRRKAFNGSPFLLYEKFMELDAVFHSLYPELDKAIKYKKYFDAVTKYFSPAGGDNGMEFKDTYILNDFTSKDLNMTLQMFPVKKEDEERSKKAIYEFDLLSECFNTIANLMYSDEGYQDERSYNQYLNDRQIEAEQEKQRIQEESQQKAIPQRTIEILNVEREEQFCDAYSSMIITLAKELKATNGFFTRDSKEYKALASCLQREAALLQMGIPSENSIKESLSELTVFADAYIRHVPKNPDSRQRNRSDICNTIKAVSKLAQEGRVNPRAGLETMFMKTLLYNENPDCFSPQNKQKTLSRAEEIYGTPSVQDELDKLSIVKLVAPSKKNLDAITGQYNKAVTQAKKNEILL